MTREEAIKKIKEEMPTLWKETKEAIQVLIPELAENEEGRIRKEIIELLNQYKEDGLRGVGITPWIDYPEKLKENTWSEDDDAKVKAMVEEERAWLKNLRNRVWKM